VVNSRKIKGCVIEPDETKRKLVSHEALLPKKFKCAPPKADKIDIGM